ncbi:MAG TPA: CCA tRNA nucleotidyltransferase [archaeon]|nr:CCA tRNA nucleotidyltransferase [archaeon]
MEILKKALDKVTPTEREIAAEKKFAQKLIAKIMGMRGKHTKVQLVGSIARGTHLRGDNDLDIFVFFPEGLSREGFEKEGLRIGKAVFRGHKWEKAYSEHPYIRGIINGFRVEIVPAYDIEDAAKLKSAVDRSALHNEYLVSHFKKGQQDEARLLKQFMKGVKTYGADLSVSSFPGYVAELLIIKYGTFESAVKAAAKWENGEVIDVEYHTTSQEARKKFETHFIVIDPVDKNRNVAAALSQNQYARFIAACRAFTKKPSLNFFFPKPHKAWSGAKLSAFLKKTEFMAVMLGYPTGIVEDIMWGQLKRFGRKIAQMAQKTGFALKRSEEWLEHKKHMIVLLEVESATLQKAKILSGPPATDQQNSQAFIAAHPKPLSGPRIENGKWVIEVEREYTELEKFLPALLKKLKKEEREGIRKALKGVKIMREKEIISLYRKNRAFQQFLTGYLKGEEDFLDY